MRTKIISAFPGTVKTLFHKKYPTLCLDSDSSKFSWLKNEDGTNSKHRHPDFPQNYVNHIKENIGKYKYIFVSSHKEIRDALLDNCIFFYLVYPYIERKKEFLERYKNRGNNDSFIELIDKNWDSWINDIINENDLGCFNIEMVLENLENELSHLECVINGEK